jgi:hypothetical protein
VASVMFFQTFQVRITTSTHALSVLELRVRVLRI